MPASVSALRTQPMIGLPSGLERVRWNESASSPQPAITPSMRAPRAVAASRLSSTSAPAPSASTKPSRFFENGFDACCGVSFCVDSADSSEKRTSASTLTEESVATQSAASVSPRRIASTPSWMALTPEAQAVEIEIGEPLVPYLSASWSAAEPNRKRRWASLYLPPPLSFSMAS